MSQSVNNNRRIAKNTLFLYFRMILTMLVSLYTSRIVLKSLGVSDYGIYNVVAGVITMLGGITGSLAGTCSRYITVALGKNDFKYLREVFGSTLMVQILLSIVVFVLGESIGLWFVLNKLVIPPERLSAAFWVYQFSIITSIISLLNVPYNALIIAHEKMDVFAFISILEAVAKLIGVYLLTYIRYDSLIIYGIIILIIQLSSRFINTAYCRTRFNKECVRALRWNPSLLKEIISYSGWSSLSYLAITGCTQGLNIVLNLFFGPAINTARGIAVQIQSATTQLCGNFQMAINPQIIKSCASGNYGNMHKLVVYSSRYSYYIMLIVIVPLIVNAGFVLDLWLEKVPGHTVAFVRLTLLIALVECLKNPILAAIHATGNIRKFQTVEGCFLLSIVPVSYVLLRLGKVAPETVFIVYLTIEFFTQIVRLKIILPRISMKYGMYIREVMLPIGIVSILVSSLFAIFRPCETFMGFVVSTLAMIVIELCIVVCFGGSKTERALLFKMLYPHLDKFKNLKI